MKGFKQGAQTGGLGSAGEAMGFKRGGQVKVKDTGNMPAKPQGDSQQEKEAGGRPKVRPGYMKGGKASCAKGGKAMKKGPKGAKAVKRGDKKAGKAAKRGKK